MPTKPAGSTVLLALLGASVGVASSASAASTAARRLVEVTPAKGLMLMRTWQTRADTMNVLKTVPDGKTGKKLKVVSAVEGEEAARRALCKQQFRLFQERAAALASADASDDYPEARRQIIPELKIGGVPRGANARLFATLGEGASTLSIVECGAQWNLLSLCVSPDAREIDAIVSAEVAALDELRGLCGEAGATLRVLPDVEAALAGSRERLGLAEDAGSGPVTWLYDASEETPASPSAPASAPSSAASTAAVHDALRSRRTINNFAAELPDGWEDALRRAVEAATYAPNHKRTEPWRFHLLGEKAVRRVCELNAELVTSSKGEEAGAKKLRRWLQMPGWLVVTCVRGEGSDASMDPPMGSAREDYAACCCAVQNLCLSLHADGLGTKWTTGPVNFDERFAAAAGLPANEYVVGTIWFGAAEGAPPPTPQKRLAVDDVLRVHD